MVDIKSLKAGDVIVSLAERRPFREIGDIFYIKRIEEYTRIYYIQETQSNDPNTFRLPTPKELEYFLKDPILYKNIKDHPVETEISNYSVF